MDSAQWIVWVVQDLNNLEITFDYTSPIHLPCPMSATTLQETAGQLFIESCLDGMNCPSLVALRIWFFFNVFLPLRIRNEGQCMASTVIGTWIIHVTLHSQRLFTLGLTGCSNPPVHIIWTFMLGGIYFSHWGEFNSLFWFISEARAFFPCLARGFVLWGQQLFLPVLLHCPGTTPSGYFLKDLRPACSQVMIPGTIHPYGMSPLGAACHQRGSKFAWSGF